jgi:hypothetical protein
MLQGDSYQTGYIIEPYSTLLIAAAKYLGGIMLKDRSSIAKWGLIVAILVMTLPVTTFAQRRWVVVRPGRQRVVVYQPRPTVIYRQSYASPYYNYPQPYYNTGYYNYGYSQPYYGTTYYSYRYSQPYYANRYAYANPTYSYTYREYRPRYRRSRVRFGIYFR